MNNFSSVSAEMACLDDLYGCLQSERMFLVLYRVDSLLENNSRKEILTENLNQVRAKRRLEMSDEALKCHSEEWRKKNDAVSELCDANARFIENSLKRQALLMDNLRKLMGGPSIYSKRGDKSHPVLEGRVLAKRY